MTQHVRIDGRAAALRIENLDTDQIMPKQFLRGIDKSGLKEGLLYDLRFDAKGVVRPDFVLNRDEYKGASILVGGANFGCGSSREHAVWGLQQFGIRAVVASSYAEIFYANAMNNRLLLVTLPPELVAKVMNDADDPSGNVVEID
ncbi:MAG TPA: 3-isopropylmalate dehydratase small subunit, partial [Burkholderiaceae bacterium]|nr:3-isopropylmalate dehydratase small subunit [Burkholderiaceae bacterium]